MKTQALLLLICGIAAVATAAKVTDPAATVTVQPNSTALETVFHTVTNFHPQASTSSSLLLAKRPTLTKKSDDDDPCIPGSLSPLELTCENFGKDVKCNRHSFLKNPFGDRADTFVACIQSCRKDSGLNRYIHYKGRYLDMSLEEYDEWIRNGAEHQTAAASAAAASTTTEAAATVTVWTNLATTNQAQSTGFQTSFRTVSSSAPLASSSVLLGERSVSEQEDSAMQSCHGKAAGQQKCRTKCG